MATIRTALQIQDSMTPVFKNITNALGATISAFEEMKSATNSSVNTASIEAARAELTKAAVAVNSIEDNIRSASAAQEHLNATMRNVPKTTARPIVSTTSRGDLIASSAAVGSIERNIRNATSAQEEFNSTIRGSSGPIAAMARGFDAIAARAGNLKNSALSGLENGISNLGNMTAGMTSRFAIGGAAIAAAAAAVVATVGAAAGKLGKLSDE